MMQALSKSTQRLNLPAATVIHFSGRIQAYVYRFSFPPARGHCSCSTRPYSYPTAEDHNAALEQRKEFREAVKKYVKSEMPNLDGFSLFDESSRYEIDFPPGWKSEKESQNKTDN
jgi:hypothetical protein